MKEFTGTSVAGDLQEAVNQAIEKAKVDIRKTSDYFEWELKTITGKNGGIAGAKELSVTIATALG